MVQGFNPSGNKTFCTIQTGPGSYSPSCKMGTGSLAWRKNGQGMALTTHLHLVLMLKKE